jgi:hypothetical protein
MIEGGIKKENFKNICKQEAKRRVSLATTSHISKGVFVDGRRATKSLS